MLPTKFRQARRLFRRIQQRSPREVVVGPPIPARAIQATYDYVDEQGDLLFQVVRYAGKEFRQRRPDGAGGWIWKLGYVRRVLYHLDELSRGDPTVEVYVAEGEKDVDALRQRGLLATCNPCGAPGWRTVSACARTVLAGRDVVVIADRDDSGVGQKHGREVEASLRGVARSVRVVVTPPPCKDISELFDARPGQQTTLILRELIDLDDYEVPAM
jgi:putative DNA primase/helicase